MRGKHHIIDRVVIYIISAIADTSLAAFGGGIILGYFAEVLSL